MESLFSGVLYWLVDHPAISHYEWKQGQTFGSSPAFVAAAVTAYLFTALFLRHYGDLRPLSSAVLRRITAAHNVFLCLLSLAMAAGCSLAVLRQVPAGDWSWVVCFPAGRTPPHGPTFFWAHVAYFSKILEFADTLLILLSGPRGVRRLTFLHLYHHSLVVVTSYLGLATSQTMLPVGIVTNAAVHVVMYAYYLLTGLGHRPPWKRAVTECQIVQFVFAFVVSGLMLYYHFTGSGCSGIWAWCFNAVFVASLLALFLNFHNTNYNPKNKEP
ncbi:unnamed protein product [Cuscuta campestris]|uniref:very-long-chain 3-oxoacyl-CoA synthase n=1 Tax=Cuscuta campestris TaxID=132261 RepID=A0A484LPD9_9ASTE|nr:unnamed protein product [Cuscuta campestris]